MHHYRCYFLDNAKHIVRVEVRECIDDADAIRWANGLFGKDADRVAIEVWCRARILYERAPLPTL